jgi:endonuclease/exonuclease/phosphatase family metal-dependent hydrolase
VRSVAISAAALTGIACLSLPGLAQAGSPAKVTKPSGIHLVKVSSSSFTVASKRSPGARGYRLFVSSDKSDLAVAKLAKARRSKVYATPRLSMKGLHYATTPYYYRLEAVNGSRHSFSTTIGAVGLRPAAPTDVVVSSGNPGTALTWDSGPATGYLIEQSTDPTMAGSRVYRITGLDQQFTPPDVTDGTTYYFAVAALNGSTASAYSTPTAGTEVTTEQQPLSVLTYNILEATSAGRPEGGTRVAPWSKRKAGVVALIKRANPDVVAIQEGAAWANGVPGPRQVDSLKKALGSTYRLADTEIAYPQHPYFRTGDYILYKSSLYKAVGAGGHWQLNDSNPHFAAYQVLQNRSTGAKFLFVAPHLTVNTGLRFDKMRKAETQTMITDANAFVESNPIPIVYAGDFNSDVTKHHSFDGPGMAMRAANVDDAFDVAQARTNGQFNSANAYFRRPPEFGCHIDYVFAPPGVAVTSWRMLLDLSRGKIVGTIPSDHNPVVANLRLPY